MKRYILLLVLLSLIAASCGGSTDSTSTQMPSTPASVEEAGFLKTNGSQIINSTSQTIVRLQAVNFTHQPNPEDYTGARMLGFNTVRLNLDLEMFGEQAGYLWLDEQVSSAQAAGVYLIFGLTSFGGQSDFWENSDRQQVVLDFWGQIAERYAETQTIAAYDILHLPSPTTLDQWQSLAQAIRNTIRAMDEDHILIVQAALVPDRTFIYLEDSNYMLGFDFFKPYEFTTLGRSTYPISTLFQPEWEDFRITEFNNNPKLAPGTTDWTETAASLNLVMNRETVVGLPGLTCSNLLGSAWFGDFVIKEYDETGQYLQDVLTIKLADSPFWGPWSGNNSARIEKVNESPWGASGQSIRFSPVQDGVPADGTVADTAFAFEVTPGHSYTTFGWIRGENVNPDATCRFNIEFYSYAGKDQLHIWDREHLNREIERLSKYGEHHNVPMMVVDFGVVRQTAEQGGKIWAEDMMTLLDESLFHYAWKSYRDDTWGILAGDATTPSSAWLDIFHRTEIPMQREVTNSDDPQPIPPLVKGFVRAKGQDLVIGASETPIQLLGINFNNDLYNLEFPNTPHHARRDFFEVRELGFNAIRFNLTYQWFTETPDIGWAWLDQQIEWAKEAGIYLVINIHYVPGQWIDTFSYTENEQSQTVELWKTLAERYKDETIIAGYDLLNEPFDIQPADYQQYMQKIVDAIREVDPNHLIIVEAINSYTPEFVIVNDDNVMYDFHFYHPLHLTHENAGGYLDYPTYPNDEFLELRWDRLKYLGAVRTDPIPAGSSDWALTESRLHDPGKQDDAQAFGYPIIYCNRNSGRAYFGDFQVIAVDQTGTSTVIIDQVLGAETITYKSSNSGTVIFGLVPENHEQHPDKRSLVAQGYDSLAWIEFPRNSFEVQPDVSYQIVGWLKGEEISAGSECTYQIDFFQFAPEDTLLRHNRDFLMDRIMVGLRFQEQYNVPINIGEFGVFQTAFLSENYGGTRWVQDMLNILMENNINFAYWDYRGGWGLYPDSWHYPDPADINTALANEFLSAFGLKEK